MSQSHNAASSEVGQGQPASSEVSSITGAGDIRIKLPDLPDESG